MFAKLFVGSFAVLGAVLTPDTYEENCMFPLPLPLAQGANLFAWLVAAARAFEKSRSTALYPGVSALAMLLADRAYLADAPTP